MQYRGRSPTSSCPGRRRALHSPPPSVAARYGYPAKTRAARPYFRGREYAQSCSPCSDRTDRSGDFHFRTHRSNLRQPRYCRPGSSRPHRSYRPPRSGRHPYRPNKFPVGERPDPHGLVVRPGHGKPPRHIGRRCPENARMHSRIDGQNRPVVIDIVRRLDQGARKTEEQQRGENYRAAFTSRNRAISPPPTGFGWSDGSVPCLCDDYRKARRRPRTGP